MAEKGVGYYQQKFSNLVLQELNNKRSLIQFKGKIIWNELIDIIEIKEKRQTLEVIGFNIVAQDYGYIGDSVSGNKPSIHVYDSRFLNWAEEFKKSVEQMTQDEGVPIQVRVVQEFA